jgi:hypothetical protein
MPAINVLFGPLMKTVLPFQVQKTPKIHASDIRFKIGAFVYMDPKLFA